MAYVPAYMGNVSSLQSVSDNNGEVVIENPETYESLQYVHEVEDMPLRMRASGLWDI